MTPLQSTISEMDFKFRLIAHFKKCFDKGDQSMKDLMISQTKRIDLELQGLLTDKKIHRAANKLARKYGVARFARIARES